jgi:hypothetical protein
METIPEMTVTEVDRARVTGDPGRVTDERPDPEVPERARRRSFTVKRGARVAARPRGTDSQPDPTTRGNRLRANAPFAAWE